MSHMNWQIQAYQAVPDVQVRTQTVQEATLSRSDSGRIYWDKPSPRSYVRGAVYDQRLRLVTESQRKGGVNSDVVASVNPLAITPGERSQADTELSGRWLYAGSWMHAFGHFLVETLPTLWPLISDPDGFEGIAAHRFNSARTFDWQFDLVRALTDLPVHVVVDEPASVKELVVPARLYHYQQAIHPLAAAVWDRISQGAASEDDLDGDPVYLSRTRFEKAQRAKGTTTGREYPNGEDIDELFGNRGFRVVFPEELSLVDQVRLARSAPVLAGPGGSALHLSVFSKPGARVIELGDSRTKDRMVNTQRAISAAKQQKAALVPYAAGADGAIDLGALKENLELIGM